MADIEMKTVRGKETFILIHGAWACGADPMQVNIHLAELGHKVYAPDLPGHGMDPASIEDVTLQDYIDKIVALIDRLDEQVILVGHSMAGIVISSVAEARPEKVKKLIYMNAFMLKDGQAISGECGVFPADWTQLSQDGKTVPFYGGVDQLFASCPFPNLISADEATRRTYILDKENLQIFYSPIHLTEERYGRIPRYYICGTMDGAIPFDLQKAMIAASPCEEVYCLESCH